MSAAPPRLFILFLITAGSALGLAGTDLVLPAIPTLPEKLGGTQAMAQYVLAAYVAGVAEIGRASCRERVSLNV